MALVLGSRSPVRVVARRNRLDPRTRDVVVGRPTPSPVLLVFCSGSAPAAPWSRAQRAGVRDRSEPPWRRRDCGRSGVLFVCSGVAALHHRGVSGAVARATGRLLAMGCRRAVVLIPALGMGMTFPLITISWPRGRRAGPTWACLRAQHSGASRARSHGILV